MATNSRSGVERSAAKQAVYPIAIGFVSATMTLPPDPEVEYDEHFQYDPAHHTYQMMVAGDTGLAYANVPVDGSSSYTVVHLPSGRFLNLGWFVETEQLAQRWIGWLIQLADWSGPVPRMKQDQLSELLALLCAGMLVDARLEDDPDTFDPKEQLQFASGEDERVAS